MRRITRTLLALAAPYLFHSISYAAWDPSGNPVVVAPGDQFGYSATAFGAGGVLVAWADSRGGGVTSDIYAMALTATGDPAPGWPANGVAITSAPGLKAYPSVVVDAAGGAFIAWHDLSSGSGQLYLQHVTGTGSIASGWPAGGILVASYDAASHMPPIESDGEGGVYLAWNTAEAIRIGRFTGSGAPAPGWPASGLELGPGSASPRTFSMKGDGAGGLFAMRIDPWFPVFLHRWMSDGTTHPDWPAAGMDVGARPELLLYPVLLTDVGDGVIAAWSNVYPGVQGSVWSETYATRVSSAGVLDPSWPAGGMLVGHGGSIASDGLGGVLDAWSPSPIFSEPYGRALASRTSAGGDRPPGWNEDGNHVCSEPHAQAMPSIVSDGTGGAFLSWIDYRTGFSVLYVMRLTADGAFANGWPERGSIGAPDAYQPQDQSLVVTGPGTAIVVWNERRNGTVDIYAEEAVPGPAGPPTLDGVDGRPRTAFAISRVEPNPAVGRFRVRLALIDPSPVSLELIDIAGRIVESRRLERPDPSRAVEVLNESQQLVPGIYWLRARQGPAAATARVVVAR